VKTENEDRRFQFSLFRFQFVGKARSSLRRREERSQVILIQLVDLAAEAARHNRTVIFVEH
jgi:hypothetical protein